MFSEPHPRIQYRWGRTISTRSQEVLLLPSFAKDRPIPLKWDSRRLLYISQDRVATPCGRHGAKLLVDGATYPCDNFTVASPMFEVSIYTKDNSSDEDQLPSLQRETRELPSEQLNRTSGYGKNIWRPFNSRSRWSSNEELRRTDHSTRKKLRFGDYSSTSNICNERSKKMEGTRILPVRSSSTAMNGIGNFGRCLSTGSLSHIPCRDEVYSSMDDFQTGAGSTSLLGGGVSDGERCPGHRSVITSVEVSSDPHLPHQRYVKRSVEMSHNTNQVFKSFEKSLAIVDNATEVCSGSERLVEVGLSGHETTLNVVTVQLRDCESQTGDYETDDSSQPLELSRELEEVEDSSHLFLTEKAKPYEEHAIIKLDDESDQEVKEVDHLETELASEAEIVDGPSAYFATSPTPVSMDEPSTDDMYEKEQMQVSEMAASDEMQESDAASETIDDYVMTPAVCALARVEEKPSVSSPDGGDVEELDASEAITADGAFDEAEESAPPLVELETSKPTSGVPTGTDSGVAEVKQDLADEGEPLKPAGKSDPTNEESLEEVKERVSDRERQVRRLQQEILLLEDSHRYLYRERAQLLQEAQSNKSQAEVMEDNLQVMAMSEDRRSLSEEVKALRVQVAEQERANSSLEWEVKELRTRLDSNDPAEVAQLLEEMRSLRDELSLLADRNRDLYDEITALREENGRLRRRQSLEAAAMARAPTLLAFVATSTEATQRTGLPSSSVTFPNVDELEPPRALSRADISTPVPDDHLPMRDDSASFTRPKSITPRKSESLETGIKGPDVVVSSNSESEGTQYQDLPASSNEFLASRQTPESVERGASPLADVMTQTPSRSPKMEEYHDAGDGRRSFGVQTLTGEEEENDDAENALSPGSIRANRRRHNSGRHSARRKVYHHTCSNRAPYGQHVSSSVGFVHDPSSDSGSSTDSLLTEADTIIRESMHQLLDGVKDHGGRASTSRTSRHPDRHVTRSIFSSSTSVPGSGGGSGSHTRTVSYRASDASPGPFIPKASSDLYPGDMVRFMHPRGGVAQGTVRYVGRLPGQVDNIVGLELMRPTGNSDGHYGGLHLFECFCDEESQNYFPSVGLFVE